MPSLQTIPKPVYHKDNKGQQTKEIKTPGLRDIFIPRKGHLLAKADFSQLELRLIGILANDRPLVDAYKQGLDVHTLNARDLFELENIDKNQRQFAKLFAYAVNYGSTCEELWKRMLIDFPGTRLDLIESLVEKWFKTHWAIKQWQYDQKLLTEKLGYVEAPLSGRRQYYHDGKVNLNEIYNFPVQATGADIIDPAIIEIDKQIDWVTTGIVAQVHDEINLDGENALFMFDLLKKEMEWEVDLMGDKHSFPVDVSIGTSWAWTKEFGGDKLRGLGPREELIDCLENRRWKCDKVINEKGDKCSCIGKDGKCTVLWPRK